MKAYTIYQMVFWKITTSKLVHFMNKNYISYISDTEYNNR